MEQPLLFHDPMLRLVVHDPLDANGTPPYSGGVREFTRPSRGESDRSLRGSCLGRDAEMEQLFALYDAARQGEQLAIIEGAAGAGKSYLLRAFRTEIRLTGGVVLEGRCEPGSAFGPFAAIVERALGFLNEMGASPSAAEDLGCFAGCHALWHQHPRHGDLSDAGDSQSAHERRLLFFDAIRTLLADVARFRPPVVLLHDLERADAGTLQLLRFLFEGSGPWTEGVSPERSLKALFVGSFRADADGPAIEERLRGLHDHDAATVLRLGPFDREGVRAFLQSDAIVDRIVERTGGLPEAIELLLEADPLTPMQRLKRRLDREGEALRHALEILAILGQPAEPSLIDEIAGQPRTDLHPLMRSDLVIESRLEGSVRYAFARSQHRDLLYDGLTDDRRIALHRRCAEVFAARPSQGMAAHHALLAGDTEQALQLALIEARGLADRHAHAEAAALLERTINGLDKSRLSGALLEQLSDLHRIVGDYRRAIVHARTLWERAEHCPTAAHRVGRLLTLYGKHEEAEKVLRTAQRLAGDHQDDKTRTTIETLLAELYYQMGRHDDAQHWAERALETALTLDERTLEIHARNTLGKVALAGKTAERAVELFEYNRVRADALALGHQRAQALINRGVAMLRLVRYDEARDSFESAITEATAAGDSRELAIATENLAVLAHLQHDYRSALDYYHRSVAQLKRLGNRPMLTRVGINMGGLYFTLGDMNRARALCDFAQHMGGTSLPTFNLARCLLLRGRIEFAQGFLDKAGAFLETSAELFASIDSTRQVEPLVELVRIRLEHGDVPGARALLSDMPAATSPSLGATLAIVGADLERAAGGDTAGAIHRALDLATEAKSDELLLEAFLRATQHRLDVGDASGAVIRLQDARTAEQRLNARVPDDCRDMWDRRPARLRLVQLEAAVGSVAPRSLRPSARPKGPERSAEHRRRYPEIAGNSQPILRVLDILDKIAPSDATVLIRGESGTGKELIADALHRGSNRKERPLVKVNCAALVETLLLSELFGHERGAFTGANARKKGRFELADGGTLFLDEIGDISPATQVALLRVLQEREFERVGGTQSIKVDVRIVAATHRDLEAMVAEGTFREDLYYRLRGVSVEMPSLRERPEDLGELCTALLQRIADERGEQPKLVTEPVLQMLSRHRWPGNIRELENVLRSAALFAEGEMLKTEDFGAFSSTFNDEQSIEVKAEGPVMNPVPAEDELYHRIRSGENSLFEMKKLLERECIIRALSDAEGNITKAAELLGMKRPRLSQLVKQYGLESYKKVQS